MNQLWTSLLQFINQLVSPDWGALVALVPLVLLGMVVLYLAWVVVRFAKAGPTRRGGRPITPRPPPGVHAGIPSWAPILAAIGVFVLFYGLVFHGWVLFAGVAILVLTLIYWGREAIRDYDHIEHPPAVLLAPAHTPPPGVHMPGPSFRPILASIALAVLFYGLVFGGWLILAGVLMVVISLLGWLGDARAEYRGVVVADVTGHLPAQPRPGYPKGTLLAFAVLFVGAIVLNSGILPPKSADGGAAPGAAPAGSPAPSSGGAGTGAGQAGGGPSPGSGGAPADVTITAANIAFVGTSLDAPAGRPFTIHFQNNDAGIPHNVDIHKDSGTGTSVWKGEIFPGVDWRLYEAPPLEPGTYAFACDVHPTMTGTLTVK